VGKEVIFLSGMAFAAVVLPVLLVAASSADGPPWSDEQARDPHVSGLSYMTEIPRMSHVAVTTPSPDCNIWSDEASCPTPRCMWWDNSCKAPHSHVKGFHYRGCLVEGETDGGLTVHTVANPRDCAEKCRADSLCKSFTSCSDACYLKDIAVNGTYPPCQGFTDNYCNASRNEGSWFKGAFDAPVPELECHLFVHVNSCPTPRCMWYQNKCKPPHSHVEGFHYRGCLAKGETGGGVAVHTVGHPAQCADHCKAHPLCKSFTSCADKCYLKDIAMNSTYPACNTEADVYCNSSRNEGSWYKGSFDAQVKFLALYDVEASEASLMPQSKSGLAVLCAAGLTAAMLAAALTARLRRSSRAEAGFERAGIQHDAEVALTE